MGPLVIRCQLLHGKMEECELLFGKNPGNGQLGHEWSFCLRLMMDGGSATSHFGLCV